ncbi:MAG: hypothetical protein M0C28_20340 [Candidatus Moduliflexus flocculans]|nr:hypothetical protein [Candidatus Moduliflexus flocculans]
MPEGSDGERDDPLPGRLLPRASPRRQGLRLSLFRGRTAGRRGAGPRGRLLDQPPLRHPWTLAGEVLERSGKAGARRPMTASAELALTDRLLRELCDAGELEYFGMPERPPTPGLADALHRAIRDLRLAGLTSADLRPERFLVERKGREIALSRRPLRARPRRGRPPRCGGLPRCRRAGGRDEVVHAGLDPLPGGRPSEPARAGPGPGRGRRPSRPRPRRSRLRPGQAPPLLAVARRRRSARRRNGCPGCSPPGMSPGGERTAASRSSEPSARPTNAARSCAGSTRQRSPSIRPRSWSPRERPTPPSFTFSRPGRACR